MWLVELFYCFSSNIKYRMTNFTLSMLGFNLGLVKYTEMAVRDKPSVGFSKVNKIIKCRGKEMNGATGDVDLMRNLLLFKLIIFIILSKVTTP